MARIYHLYISLYLTISGITAYGQTEMHPQASENPYLTTDTLSEPNDEYEKLNKDFIVNGIQDFTYTLSRPAHWKQKDWLKFSAVIGGTGALMLADKEIRHFFLHNQNQSTVTAVANGVKQMGDVYGLCAFPAVYVVGLASGNKKMQSIGLRGSKAVVISSTIFTLSKNIIRRGRPDVTDNPFDFAPPFSKVRYKSFPSGHTTIAFAIATSLAEEFPDKKWIAPVAYTLASMTGISRLYHNRHWASDVFIGAALGHFVTKAVYHHHRKRHRLVRTY